MGDEPAGGTISRLRGDLLNHVVFTPGIRPQVHRELVEQFELKRQRLMPGYSPDTPRELVDWVKERLLIPSTEWEQLLQASVELVSSYPGLEVLPVCADYTSDFELPATSRPCRRRAVYFPGSTIGNFDPIEARHFLGQIARLCGQGGALLIGVDLKKDPAVLHRAYNDPQGVTAAFNLNLLERVNRELNGDFQLDQFEHRVFYNPEQGRVEMHLVSLRDQTIRLDNATISFAQGESIWTESSYKYTLEEFERLAAAAGFKVEHVWTDARKWFSVQYLVNTGTTR